MADIEHTGRKLVLKERSTTLTLDKESGKGTLQLKVLLWNKKAGRVRAFRHRRHRSQVGHRRSVGRVNPSQRHA
jgi:hypothetical protein